MTRTEKRTAEIATFGAGCFWGVEETLRAVPGVLETAVGYMGGTVERPTYEMVCTNTTGHAEVVQVTYDPSVVSYEELLKVFWECHDPTRAPDLHTRVRDGAGHRDLNRQDHDRGEQYSSVIFFSTLEQEEMARRSKERLEASGAFADTRIVTQIIPASTLYPAEEYHQKYLMKRGLGSCRI